MSYFYIDTNKDATKRYLHFKVLASYTSLAEASAALNTSQSIINNTTEFTLSIYAYADSYTAAGAYTYKINMGGVEKAGLMTSVTAAKDGNIIAITSAKVPHNEDGTLNLAYSIEVTPVDSGAVLHGEGVQTIATIPRVSISSVSSFTDETSPTVNYKNPWGEDVTSIQAGIRWDDIWIANYRNIPANGYAYTFTLTPEEITLLRQQFTGNELSKDIVVSIQTVVDGNTYEATKTATCTLVNYMPVLDPIVQDHNDTTIALTGDPNILVKYYSNVYFDVNATARKEATITALSAKNGQTTFEDTYSGYFGAVESGVFDFAVTDSRNKTVTKTLNKTLIPYVPLTCQMNIGLLTGAGTLEVTLKGKYYDGDFGGNNPVNNQLYISYLIEDMSSSQGGTAADWISLGAVSTTTDASNNYTYSYTIEGLEHTKQYMLTVVVRDKLTPAEITLETVIQAIPVFDWGKTDFRFNVPVYINGASVDAVIDEGTTDGYSLDADSLPTYSHTWCYRKWLNGLYECWCSINVSTAVTKAWGSLYTSGRLDETNLIYPLTFKENPVVNVTLVAGYAGGILMTTGDSSSPADNYSTGTLEIARAASVSNAQYRIDYYVRGYWK